MVSYCYCTEENVFGNFFYMNRSVCTVFVLSSLCYTHRMVSVCTLLCLTLAGRLLGSYIVELGLHLALITIKKEV